MKPVISLSTSCLRRFKDGYEMLAHAAELGFEYVELSHGVSVSQVDGIEKAVAEGVVKISSLHNFCPMPPFASAPAPNLFSPATKSENESAQWRRHTLNTLEFAASVGASRVVSHSGELHYFFGSPKYRLQKIYNSLFEARDSLKNAMESGAEVPETFSLECELDRLFAKYKTARKKFTAAAEKRARAAHEIIFKNVESVHAKFAEKNILLGLENRDGWCELPFDTMYGDFVARLNTLSHARGWIDIGHGQVKAQRGMIGMREFLESVRGKICAWHIHDTTSRGEDHKPLGKEVTDFNLVKSFFDPATQSFVLELSPSVGDEDIVDSRKRLEDMF